MVTFCRYAFLLRSAHIDTQPCSCALYLRGEEELSEYQMSLSGCICVLVCEGSMQMKSRGCSGRNDDESSETVTLLLLEIGDGW